MSKIKQLLCGLFTNHVFKSNVTQIKYNDKDGSHIITETCSRCGKQFICIIPKGGVSE